MMQNKNKKGADEMETLGILHTGKAGKPRVKSIAAMWNFDGDCPHVMTEARIQKKGSHDMVTVSALWDTGASTCAISTEALKTPRQTREDCRRRVLRRKTGN